MVHLEGFPLKPLSARYQPLVLHLGHAHSMGVVMGVALSRKSPFSNPTAVLNALLPPLSLSQTHVLTHTHNYILSEAAISLQ